jgi:hypothetical protein
LIQTGHLNLGGQHALPQPQVPLNFILQPHPGIVNVLETRMQPHNDGWCNIPINPSSSANQWPIDPPPSPIHTTATNAYFLYPLVNPILPDHNVVTNTSILLQKITKPHHMALKLTKESNQLLLLAWLSPLPLLTQDKINMQW